MQSGCGLVFLFLIGIVVGVILLILAITTGAEFLGSNEGIIVR